MALTNAQIDLSLAGGKAGVFTSNGVASGSTIALFTTLTTSAGLATVSEAYKLTAVNSGVTYINAGSTTHGWAIDASGGTNVATIKGGDYNDSIKAVKGEVISGLGKDTIDLSGTGATDVKLTDYNYDSDVIVVSTTASASTAKITSDGKIRVATSDLAQLNAVGGYYKAVLAGSDDKVVYWKGGTSAQRLDGSSETKELYMEGGDGADTLVGGSKDDVIVTGSIEGAYAIGGAGADSIVLGSTDGAANDNEDKLRQSVEISSSSGKDVVRNFSAGFADTDDVLVLADGAIEDAKFTATAGGLEVKVGSGQASLSGAGAANTNAFLLMKTGSGDVAKVAVVNDALAAGYVPNADSLAGYYVSTGKVGKVDFSNISDDVVAELSNAGNFEDNATFKGIDSVVGGTGNSTLIGDGEVKNYIAAGGGKTTLWGGGSSKDTLVGAAGVDAYFVGLRDGKDTIIGFQTGVDADSDDVLYMLNSPATSLNNNGTDITFTFADGSAAVLANDGTTVSTSADKAIRFSLDGTTIQAAMIGNSTSDNQFTYSGDVDMYFGGSATDTLKVDNTFEGSNVDIRLNNTLSQSYSSIERVDAASYTGGTAFIAGNDNVAEYLVGGQGKTTLWGGLGANDTLKSTAGDVTGFYFGKNNGEDVITGSDTDDKVVFYDFANTDLTAIDNTGSQMKFTFNDGSSLQIRDYTTESVKTFEFTNGTWTYDKESKTFTQTK